MMKSKLFCFIIIAAVMSTMGIKEYVPVVTRQTLTKDDWSEIEKSQKLARGATYYPGDDGIVKQYIYDINRESWDAWNKAKEEEKQKVVKLYGTSKRAAATTIQKAFKAVQGPQLAARAEAARTAAAAKAAAPVAKPGKLERARAWIKSKFGSNR